MGKSSTGKSNWGNGKIINNLLEDQLELIPESQPKKLYICFDD